MQADRQHGAINPSRWHQLGSVGEQVTTWPGSSLTHGPFGARLPLSPSPRAPIKARMLKKKKENKVAERLFQFATKSLSCNNYVTICGGIYASDLGGSGGTECKKKHKASRLQYCRFISP